MTAPKLKPKEKPEIKRIETDYKSIKALRNFICGIDFILLGLISIAVQNGSVEQTLRYKMKTTEEID